MVRKGTPLKSRELYKHGWIVEIKDGRTFFIEPNIKDRDKIWIEFENHYYRVYHSERRTFIALQSTKEWLQAYLFINDHHGELKTRRLI